MKHKQPNTLAHPRALLIIGGVRGLVWFVVLGGWCGVCAAGCVGASLRGTVVRVPAEYPFLPVSVRVYPLTHVSENREGLPAVVCHVEFLDAWGESVKAAGVLTLSVTLTEGGSSESSKAVEWESVDLGDLGRNAELYDRATRTYRVQLVDLPAWIREGGEQGKRVAVRARFVMPTSEGDVTLTDELGWNGAE